MMSLPEAAAAPTQCEAAIQGKNTIYFHRCKNWSKGQRTAYDGKVVEACGRHLGSRESLIKFSPR